MTEINPVHTLDVEELRELIQGYVSYEKYDVSRQASDVKISFNLELVQLETPYVKRFELEPIERYKQIIDTGCSLAAYEDDQIIGIVLCEPQTWNQSLVIHEFHVLGSHQGRGIGRTLMVAAIKQAKDTGLRIVSCETQNTNVPAIRFYQSLGFQIEAVDLSLYTNQDWPDGEIAIWMKQKVN